MAHDVADHFEIGALVNHSSRVTVAKSMAADYRRGDADLSGIVANAMANSTAGERSVRHFRPQEHPPHLWRWRPLGFEISRECFGDCVKQGQFDRVVSL